MSRFAISVGAARDDEASQAEARKWLHDELILANPVRLGPVQWRTYEGGAASAVLHDAALTDHPNAPGLIAFLADGGVLILASVEVPDALS